MNATAKPQPSVNSVEGSALGFAGVPVFDAGPRANTAFSSTIVFAGTLRSGQDLPYAKSVAPILKNPALQLRLTSLDRMLFGFSGYGARVMARHNNVTLTSLFPEDWEIQLDVQFFLSSREKNQLPDADNLLRPLCNALSFPSKTTRLPADMAGKHYRTLAVDDCQFTSHKVQLTPFPGVGTLFDLTAIRFTALPPPHLQAARSR